MAWNNPNQTALFFDHQYLWKESIITLDFWKYI